MHSGQFVSKVKLQKMYKEKRIENTQSNKMN